MFGAQLSVNNLNKYEQFVTSFLSSTAKGMGEKLRRVACYYFISLLAMIARSAVQSSAQTFIHNAILFFDTSNND